MTEKKKTFYKKAFCGIIVAEFYLKRGFKSGVTIILQIIEVQYGAVCN